MMITQSEVKKLLDYNPETGIWTHAINRKGCVAGNIAGYIDNNGYSILKINSIPYPSHRLAFLYMTGSMPEYIDHIDGNRSNNNWSNLRETTFLQNLYNRGKNKNNKSGYKGVKQDKKTGRWVASINASGKTYYIGIFGCPTVAAIAYDKAAKKYHGEFAYSNLS